MNIIEAQALFRERRENVDECGVWLYKALLSLRAKEVNWKIKKVEKNKIVLFDLFKII